MSCVGSEGVPFNCTEGPTPVLLADVLLGGVSEGEMAGQAVQWTVDALNRSDHSNAAVRPTGATQDSTLAALFSVDPSAAAGGTTQATAYPIVAATTIFVSVNPDAGGRLPEAIITRNLRVTNSSGSEYLIVWPDFGDEIEDYGPNEPVAIYPGNTAWFTCSGSGLWRVA